jgi:hypothetical protein
LNVRVDVNDPCDEIGSIVPTLNGQIVGLSQYQNVAPYSLFGDSNGQYLNGALPPNDYTLAATIHAGSNATGVILHTFSIDFSIVDDS